jgi:transposase
MAGRRVAPLMLSDVERSELRSLASRRKTAQALALRARIVLGCAAGGQNKKVAAVMDLDKATVGKWRRRFVEWRLDGLYEEPRSGAPRAIDDARIEAVIVKTLESLPADATHWSSRGMAKASGLSVSSVRIWRVFRLQRTGWRPSSSRPIRTSRPRGTTWWGFTSRRRNMQRISGSGHGPGPLSLISGRAGRTFCY